jgi:2-polyprenyl-3-methyl-5-hydroxy-6-metoxy-1,4-benzoquinol methylase
MWGDITIMTTTQESNAPQTNEPAETEAFGGRLFEWMTGGSITLLIDVAHRCGLFDVAAGEPGTSKALAARAGLSERHVRELLGGLVAAEVFTYDAPKRTYTLPPAHAACLTGDGASNFAPTTAALAFSARYVDRVVDSIRHGGGIPYAQYRPDFTDLMDGSMRRVYDALLIDGYVPAVPGLHERLASGARVADIGCGTGHTTNLLASAYPASTVVGYDFAADAIDKARAEASERGLSNATFEVLDVTQLPTEPPFDVVFAFDAIHDQRDPAGVLRRACDALVPGGTFVMVDVHLSSNLEDNVGQPMAPYFFTASLFHCMQVSLAEGGTGLGTCWGWQTATSTVKSAPAGDPINAIYIGSR